MPVVPGGQESQVIASSYVVIISVAMVARVTTCDGDSTDYSVAGILDTPQFTLLLCT